MARGLRNLASSCAGTCGEGDRRARWAKMIGVGRPTCPRSSGTSSRRRPRTRCGRSPRSLAAIPTNSLARAGRVSSDLSEIIKQHQRELAALLRTTKGLSADAVTKLARQAQKAKDK